MSHLLATVCEQRFLRHCVVNSLSITSNPFLWPFHNPNTTDLTQGISLEKVKKWTEELHANEKDCIVFIVGTKRLLLTPTLTNRTAVHL